MGPAARTPAHCEKKESELARTELWESVSVDRFTRESSRAFIPVAHEPKKPERGTLAREKTPLLQVCRSKNTA